MSVPNQNRIIQMYRGDSPSEDASWRHNFSRCLSAAASEVASGYQVLANKDFVGGSFDVDENVDLLMAAELPKFSTGNEYDTPIFNAVNSLKKLGNIVEAGGAAISAFKNAFGDKPEEGDATAEATTTSTFMPWSQNTLAWNGTQNFRVKMNFNFAMGQYGLWNAKDEVFLPILNLIAPTLPRYLNGAIMNGPYPDAIGLLKNLLENVLGLVGDSINGNVEKNALYKDVKTELDKFKGKWDKSSGFGKVTTLISQGTELLGAIVETLVLSSFEAFTYTVKWGNIITIQKAIIKDSSWSFSKEVDQYGFPIAGNVELEIESSIPLSMTSSSVNNMSVRFGGY